MRSLLIIQVLLLTALFLFGRFVSFYEMPIQAKFSFFSLTGLGLEVHHYIAILTVIFALLAIVLGLKTKNKLVSKLSAAGLGLLASAFASGLAFVFLEENMLYSFAMSVFFILALVTFLASVFLAKE